MKKKLTLVVSLLLVMALSIGGTLAYLTDKTDAIENTFTVGNVTIELTETFNTDTDGENGNDAWTGKIVPGATVDKDPTITVVEGSEKCYVYALIENNLVIDEEVVATTNLVGTDWIAIGTSENKILYRYKEIVDASAAKKELPVFTQVTYDGNLITAENIASLNGAKIIVSAFAHQSDNIGEGTTTADTAAAGWAVVTLNP